MSAVLGDNWVGPLVLVAIVICLATAAYRFWSRRRSDGETAEAPMLAGSRLAVLESSAIDETRRLLLVRCDDVEHLILVGGAADLVVESDVRKSRALNAAKPGAAEPARRLPAPPQLPSAPQPAQKPAQAVAARPGIQAGPHQAAPQPAGLPAPAAQAEAGPGGAGKPQQPSEEKAPKLRPADGSDRAARPVLTAVPAPARNGHATPTPAVRPGSGLDEKPRVPVIGVQRPSEPPKPQPRAVADAPRAIAPAPVPAPGAEKPRARVVDRLFGRREPAAPPPPQELPAAPQQQAAAAADGPSMPAEFRNSPADMRSGDERAGSPGRPGNASAERRPSSDVRTAPGAGAEDDFAEVSSIEGEIGRALQSGEDVPPLSRQTQPGERQSRQEQPRPAAYPAVKAPEVRTTEAKPAAKPAASPATTLGDLAERLEEALAREVKAANQDRNRADPDVDAFDFQLDAPSRSGDPEPQRAAAAERLQPEPQRAAQTAPPSAPPPPVPAAARVIAPVPEPERREARAQAERQQEEAPVINLHERRREAADPLEDEMARLLGELTGDTNRR